MYKKEMKTEEEKIAYRKAYYLANRENLLAYHKIYYKANKDKIITRHKAYAKAYAKTYNKANYESYKKAAKMPLKKGKCCKCGKTFTLKSWQHSSLHWCLNCRQSPEYKNFKEETNE
ncbi:unnamed protein product [marine sediment metagenome]|uniref:Uncharacterized protein n=1 Tax=marine sediment metagenome TaxID=412755 RepID=X1B0W8_9ZZZZ